MCDNIKTGMQDLSNTKVVHDDNDDNDDDTVVVEHHAVVTPRSSGLFLINTYI